MKDPITIDDGRLVQNIIISDPTETAKVSLWQDFVKSVTLGKSYTFDNFLVKQHPDGISSLFTPRQQDTSITNIADIVDCKPFEVIQPNTRKLEDAKIVAVTEFSSKFACMSCNRGNVTAIEASPTLGTCSSCPTTALMENCPFQVSAILSIRANSFIFKLNASTEHLTVIADVEPKSITAISLLLAEKFSVTYNIQNMSIVDITRA